MPSHTTQPVKLRLDPTRPQPRPRRRTRQDAIIAGDDDSTVHIGPRGCVEDTPVFLVGLEGKYAGMVFELGNGDSNLGRSETADARVDDNGVSRCHAMIMRGRGQFTLIDCNSTNGTFINGRRVQAAQLQPGDEIRLGTTATLVFHPGGRPTEEVLRRYDRSSQ